MQLSELLSPSVHEFIRQHENDEPGALMLQRQRYPDLPMAEIVQQIQARQKARKKLPTWLATPGILFPPSLSLEQSSSEATARYKASLVSGESCADITGGFGVDSYFLSRSFSRLIYVEQQPELAQLAAHNFKQLGAGNIEVKSLPAEQFLEELAQPLSLIYLDPARRNQHQQKVHRLDDCEPDVLKLLPLLLQKAGKVLLKTAPLLDIQLAITGLKQVEKVWVVAYNADCREVLYLLSPEGTTDPQICAVEVTDSGAGSELVFTRTEEAQQEPVYSLPLAYLYEPNAAILKAGAFKTVAARFGISKLHPNSHLYTSAELITNFPGRTFRIHTICRYDKKELRHNLPAMKANLTSRNFPDTVEEIRKKTGLKEGGSAYIFATTDYTNKKVLLICSKPT